MKFAPSTLQEWLRLPLRVGAALMFLTIALVGLAWAMTWMPGESFRAAPPPLSAPQTARRARLEADLTALAGTIGERNLRVPEGLAAAADRIERAFIQAGWSVSSSPFTCRGQTVRNLIADRPGTDPNADIVLLGAHYDSVERSTGADDNASGVAVLLEAARALGQYSSVHPIRLVAFVNEEPPWFHTARMGSRVLAQQFAARGDRLGQVLVMDAVGFFCDDDCQRYPPPFQWFFPKQGNFLAVVTRAADWLRLRDIVGLMRTTATLPTEGLAAPRWLPGIDYSDHAEFWNVGYPGILLTDAPTYRNPNYHRMSDTPDTVDLERLTRTADAVIDVVRALAARR